MWRTPNGKYVLNKEGRYVEVEGHYATVMVPEAEYAVQWHVGYNVEGLRRWTIYVSQRGWPSMLGATVART